MKRTFVEEGADGMIRLRDFAVREPLPLKLRLERLGSIAVWLMMLGMAGCCLYGLLLLFFVQLAAQS